jgi:hypothetical protein
MKAGNLKEAHYLVGQRELLKSILEPAYKGGPRPSVVFEISNTASKYGTVRFSPSDQFSVTDWTHDLSKQLMVKIEARLKELGVEG